MNSGTVVIRADASAQIGCGHVMRCLALAQAWQVQGGNCIFAMAGPVEALKARLLSEDVQLAGISGVPGSADDAEQLSDLARKCDARWIVVDGYNCSEEYQRTLKRAGHRLLAIDDYGHTGVCFADLILDQNAGTGERFYSSRAPGTKLLLGTRYTLLRREFKAWRNWDREIPPVARKILVTMGGSDPEDLIERALRALDLIPVERIEATLLVGALNPRISQLQAVAGNSKRRIRVNIDCRNVPELMAWADLAVSASGSTCWEMCLLGLPAVVIDVAENQIPIARELSSRGSAIHVPRSSATPEYIAGVVSHLLADFAARTRMSSIGKKLVDGNGADRVVASLRTRAFTLRAASQNDCGVLWQWANDPTVRGGSFSPHEIGWEEHTDWFEKMLLDESAVFLVFEDGPTPVAAVRTRATTLADAEISITVAPEFRGQGLASCIINRALEHVFANTGLERIHAFIKPGNTASSQSFENAGFFLLGSARVKDCGALHYMRKRERQINVSRPEHNNDRTHVAVSC
jgi:UDP-2,4-diacetamido-2,4,6-trideoxy-beta-L-altropyranose hydrolase